MRVRGVRDLCFLLLGSSFAGHVSINWLYAFCGENNYNQTWLWRVRLDGNSTNLCEIRLKADFNPSSLKESRFLLVQTE